MPTTQEILGRVMATMSDAEHAWVDLVEGDTPQRQWSGLKHTVTSGRSITFVLQKLSSRESTFSEWYAPIRDQMKTDPLLHYFHVLRTHIEKEGMPQPVHAELVFMKDGKQVAVGEAAIGEDVHGLWVSGGITPTDDVDLANTADLYLLRNIRLPDPPSEHLGLPVHDIAIDLLALRWLVYLRQRVVHAAINTFGDANAIKATEGDHFLTTDALAPRSDDLKD